MKGVGCRVEGAGLSPEKVCVRRGGERGHLIMHFRKVVLYRYCVIPD